jgi:transposase InsO family protein
VTSEAIAAMAPRIGTRAIRGRGRGAGQLVPPPPGQPASAAAAAGAAPGRVPTPRPGPGRAAGHPGCPALAAVRRPGPGEVWAILLDEGTYLGSQSTFCRLLRPAGETRERRRRAVHPAAVKPELIAAGPNQVWSWDITKLHGPAKWAYYYLNVILDIHSRGLPRVFRTGE